MQHVQKLLSKPIYSILLAIVLWRTTLFALSFFSDSFLLYQPTFPYFDSILPETGLPRWLFSWANFDGVHYLTIVKNGYVGTGLIQAFFPLYPSLASVLNVFISHPFASLFTINHLALAGFAVVFWKWVAAQWNEKTATWSLLFLFLWPTAFFLGATYTESLFLFLVVTTFWFAHTKNWFLAAVFAGLASGTRIVGIALVPALLIEWWYATQPQKPFPTLKQLTIPLMIIGIGSLGLVTYMAYLWLTFGDPLYFYHVQAEFGAGRQESIVVLPQVFWRAIKIVMTYQTVDWRLWAYWQELALSTMAFGGLVISYFWKKKSLGLTFFATMALLLPTFTGTLSSMPRYALVCFPLWLWLGSQAVTRRWLFAIFLVGSTIALCINTVLFIQGYWVA